MTAPQISVDEFLSVRGAVSRVLAADSQAQAPTRIRQAETLMQRGFIDIPAVLDFLKPDPTPAPDSEGDIE